MPPKRESIRDFLAVMELFSILLVMIVAKSTHISKCVELYTKNVNLTCVILTNKILEKSPEQLKI